jgi:hypothetical protein
MCLYVLTSHLPVQLETVLFDREEKAVSEEVAVRHEGGQEGADVGRGLVQTADALHDGCHAHLQADNNNNDTTTTITTTTVDG